MTVMDGGRADHMHLASSINHVGRGTKREGRAQHLKTRVDFNSGRILKQYDNDESQVGPVNVDSK